MPTLGTQFVNQAELILVRTVGQIVAKSLISNQLKKLRKDSDALIPEDCSALTKNIVNALSLFVNHQEHEAARGQLDKLLKQYC